MICAVNDLMSILSREAYDHHRLDDKHDAEAEALVFCINKTAPYAALPDCLANPTQSSVKKHKFEASSAPEWFEKPRLSPSSAT